MAKKNVLSADALKILEKVLDIVSEEQMKSTNSLSTWQALENVRDGVLLLSKDTVERTDDESLLKETLTRT